MRKVMKQIYRRIYSALIGDFDLWQQLLNIAVVIAITGGIISAIVSMILGNSPVAVAAFLFTSAFAVVCLVLSMKSKDMTYAAVLFCIVADFVLFPVMFFTSGGYHGGMPIWLLLSLVISWVVIRKRILYVIYVLGLLFQCGCILYSEAHPESVVAFDSEHTAAVDVMQSLILVSLIFGIMIKYMTTAYEKKKDELDEANTILAKTNERITLQSMYTLAKTIDAKDKYTNGHSMRVARYSGMIAERLHLSDEEVEKITNMAMLHDIGKIGVPDAIINKTARLTDEEYNIIKRHPVIGYNILSEMPDLGDIATGARWHHERYDGKGYPDGLKGEEIPLAARIIGVADSYDAMTSNRSYREYMPQDTVKQELEKGKGTQFDPKIADIMLEIISEDKDYELRENCTSIREFYDYCIQNGLSEDVLLSKDNLDSFIDTCVDAYRDYPLFSHIFRGKYDEKTLASMMSVDFKSRVSTTAGIASSPEFESVMLIEPPKTKKSGLLQYVGVASPSSYMLLLNPAMYRQEDFEKYAWEKREPYLDEATWYIYVFATKKSAQGKGYGKKLINLILSYANLNGYRVCLETNLEKDVEIYEHFGFRCVDKSVYKDSMQHYVMLYEDL